MGCPSTVRHHLLIAGTGRAGTSVLVRLLTECGLSTELSLNPKAAFHVSAKAGAETFPLAPGDHPYVVKSPWAYEYIQQLLDAPHIHVDEILIPIRRLSEAASSRIIQEFKQQHNALPDLSDMENTWTDWAATPGGVIYSLEPIDQARILAHGLHILIENAEAREVPYRFLSFPRFLEDPAYLYRRIKHVLRSDLEVDEFCEIAHRIYETQSVRVGNELKDEHAQPSSGEAFSALPSATYLEKIAMGREIAELRAKIAALEAQISKVT
jgi:hypothetical protein